MAGPLHVTHRRGGGHLLAVRSRPEQDLVVPGVAAQIEAVGGPIDVEHEAAVTDTLARAHVAARVFFAHRVHVDVVVARSYSHAQTVCNAELKSGDLESVNSFVILNTCT